MKKERAPAQIAIEDREGRDLPTKGNCRRHGIRSACAAEFRHPEAVQGGGAPHAYWYVPPAAAVAASSAGKRLHAPRARLAAGLVEAGTAICPAKANERASTAWISA